MTGAAIDYMVNHEDFFSGNGRSLEIPRVGIVITDGRSQDDVLVPADNARDSERITMFAVGVANYVVEELNEIASDPDEVYSFEVATFQTIDNIRNVLALTTCLGNTSCLLATHVKMFVCQEDRVLGETILLVYIVKFCCRRLRHISFIP